MLFFEPHRRDRTLLPHDPLKALIAPRPIGWVSTRSASGAINLAPYSYFNAFSSSPFIIGFASEGRKDSIAFAAETREFVWNMPTFALREQMNATSGTYPRGESEFVIAGLTMASSRIVGVPRVAESPAALECRLIDVVELKDIEGRPIDRYLALGQVVGVHLDMAFVKNGRVDTRAMRPIARCGYDEYAIGDHMFSMRRPP